jgi:hypothetical protein
LDIKPGAKVRVKLKIKGILDDILAKLAPEEIGQCAAFEKGHEMPYCTVPQALYGAFIAATLGCDQFQGNLKTIGVEFDPCYPYAYNRMVNGRQQLNCSPVEDLMSLRMDPKPTAQFLEWLIRRYDGYGAVKPTRGTKHDHLGITFDFSPKVLTEPFMELELRDTDPATVKENLFESDSSDKLGQPHAELFHTTAAKRLFLCKRARPDVHLTIAYLCTRVRKLTWMDWDKLVRLLRFLNGTKEDVLTMSVDDPHVIKWHVDASFAVHPDFKSHTGGVMTYDQGAIQGMSRKQLLDTRSRTEAELVGADDAATKILWNTLFMDRQGYRVTGNILYQGNKSAFPLETNEQRNSIERTHALNLRYFFLTDQVDMGNLDTQSLTTDAGCGGYNTKPLQGTAVPQGNHGYGGQNDLHHISFHIVFIQAVAGGAFTDVPLGNHGYGGLNDLTPFYFLLLYTVIFMFRSHISGTEGVCWNTLHPSRRSTGLPWGVSPLVVISTLIHVPDSMTHLVCSIEGFKASRLQSFKTSMTPVYRATCSFYPCRTLVRVLQVRMRSYKDPRRIDTS